MPSGQRFDFRLDGSFMNNQWITAGLLLRGQLRGFLARSGIEYTEHKSLMESTFICHCDAATYRRALIALREAGVL